MFAKYVGASVLAATVLGPAAATPPTTPVAPVTSAASQQVAVLAREIFIHQPRVIEVQGQRFVIPGKRVGPDEVGGYRLKTSQQYSVLVPINLQVPHGSPPRTLTVKVRTGIGGLEGELGSFTFVADERSRSELVALTIFPSSANTTGKGALWTEVYEGGAKIDGWQTFVEVLPPK